MAMATSSQRRRSQAFTRSTRILHILGQACASHLIIRRR